MELSEIGLELIKTSEGFRSHVYSDVAGIATIGYGHRLLPNETFPNGITHAQALDLLTADVQHAEQGVERLVKVPLTQGQFDALVDFCFNLGAGRLASSTLLKDLNASLCNQAGEQLLRWEIAAGKVSPGLKTRREAEFQLWQSSSTPPPPLPGGTTPDPGLS